jgi:hypothetical protein
MSTMTQIEALESPRTLAPAATKPVARETERHLETESHSKEAHPFLLVFIAAFIAFNLSIGMIGSILIWLALRHSGVMAP